MRYPRRAAPQGRAMIGIRREDKNEWERRVPLIPDHVAALARRHRVDALVQPSPFRAYPDQSYEASGASAREDLSGASVIFGIKEVPSELLLPRKAYTYFSHTTKGQPYNMPMLRRLLELECTLIDYERVTDDDGRRLIFFGQHAGFAGMIDALWTLGQRLRIDGHDTPLAAVRPAHRYDSLAAAKADLVAVGEEITRVGLPSEIVPLVCGFTGTGNVSAGAQEILDLLPVVDVAPDDLAALREHGPAGGGTIYKTVFDLDQRFVRRAGGSVTLEELTTHPERFENGMLRYLEHVDLLVNGMFWVSSLPRLLTLADLTSGWGSGELRKLRVIADIACDIDGAIEATVKATTPDNPVYVYDVENGRGGAAAGRSTRIGDA